MIILNTIKLAGLITVMAAAPGVVGAMGKLGIIPSIRQQDILKSSCKRMVHSGLLVWEDGKLRLTPKGESELRRLDAQFALGKKPRRWDKKWRVLIFDIPDYRKGLRDKIRHSLIRIGFFRLQNSVWVYPYDCEDFVTLLKADFKVGKDLLYMIVDSIEGDASLKRHFGLQ